MRVLVVGASGTVGAPVAAALALKHEVLRASRHAELTVDIADPASIRALYQRIGKVDAVVSCAGDGRFAPLPTLSDEDFAYTIGSKLMGQVNLVRYGLDHASDGAAFVLTAGVFAI